MVRNHPKRKRIRRGLGIFAVLVALTILLFAASLRPSLAHYPRLAASNAKQADGVTMRFIGTAGVVLADKDNTLVLDGFVTRPSLWRVMLSKVTPDAARVRDVREKTGAARIDAVLVSHSHYDHALDAAEWVKQAGGEVWGTASTRNLALAENLDDVRIVKQGDQIAVGRFDVRVFGLDHAPPERMKGTIDNDFAVPARATDYKTGGGLGFYFKHGDCRILAVPSAGRAHTDLTDYPADVVLLSIGQLGLAEPAYIRTYWEQTVVASGARLVIPVHWDDFSRSLDRPLQPLPYSVERVDVAMREIRSLAGTGITVALPVLYEALDLSASGQC